MPKRYEALLTRGAEQDLESIYDYIAEFDSPASAGYVLDRLLDAAEGLARFPERGSYPAELLALGVRECRQVLFKPYRMIYRVAGTKVFVHLIADSRRDMKALLERRLLAADRT